MAVLTITLNPCVDKTYTVPGFALDHVHRPEQMVLSAGGKGINVARVYRKFGGDVIAAGFLAGANGDWLWAAISEAGVTPDFVKVVGESRTCIAVLDPLNGTQTELNETGPTISVEDVAALKDRLAQRMPECAAVVISGSMPPGTPSSLYGEIIRSGRENYGLRTVLDTSGEPLVFGAEACPWLLKPNVHELSAFGLEGTNPASAARTLHERYGCPYVMVTAGAHGAVLTHEGTVWEAQPPSVTVASAVGSGDSLTAAFLWAIDSGYTDGEALQLGVAAGAANATTYGAGIFPRALAFELAGRTTVNKLA